MSCFILLCGMAVPVPSKWQYDPIKLSLESSVQPALDSLFLSSFSLHRKEGSALVRIRPLSHTACPMPAAGALACTGPTTAVYVGMAVAAHPVVHALPA